MGSRRRAALAALTMSIAAVLVTWHSAAPQDASEQLQSGSSLNGPELFWWSNRNDDGAGAMGQQHGSTRDVGSVCDPDDPACTFQTAGDHTGWSLGRWVQQSPHLTPGDRSYSVQIRNDYGSGSSFEDDLGQGSQAPVRRLRPAAAMRANIDGIGYAVLPVARSAGSNEESTPHIVERSPGFDDFEKHLKERYRYGVGPLAQAASSEQETGGLRSRSLVPLDESDEAGVKPGQASEAGANLLHELRSVTGKVATSAKQYSDLTTQLHALQYAASSASQREHAVLNQIAKLGCAEKRLFDKLRAQIPADITDMARNNEDEEEQGCSDFDTHARTHAHHDSDGQSARAQQASASADIPPPPLEAASNTPVSMPPPRSPPPLPSQPPTPAPISPPAPPAPSGVAAVAAQPAAHGAPVKMQQARPQQTAEPVVPPPHSAPNSSYFHINLTQPMMSRGYYESSLPPPSAPSSSIEESNAKEFDDAVRRASTSSVPLFPVRNSHAEQGSHTSLLTKEADEKRRMGERASMALRSFLGSADGRRRRGSGDARASARHPRGYQRAFVPGLPEGWQAAVDEDKGAVYYYNGRTGQTTWVKPRA